MLRLILLILRLFIRHQVKNQAEPEPVFDGSLFTRRSRTTADYIKMAADAMIKQGKTAEQARVLIINKGMYPEHADIVMERAESDYKKWLNETGGKPIATSEEQYQQEFKEQTDLPSGITVITETEDVHFYNFGALVGEARYQRFNGRNILYQMVAQIIKESPLKGNGNTYIRQGTFANFGGSQHAPHLRVVTVNGRRETVFPYLSTKKDYSFTTKRIVEWEHENPVEAEIEGNWNGLSLGFYATDYSVNKQLYKKQADINVYLSAFAMNVKLAKTGTGIGIGPNINYGDHSYFSFTGDIQHIVTANVDQLAIGCILSLKIAEKNGVSLVIDTYVTNVNIQAQEISKNIRVSGTFWLQGELAESNRYIPSFTEKTE